MRQPQGRRELPEAWEELESAVDCHVIAAGAVATAVRSGDAVALRAALVNELKANDRYATALRQLGFAPPFAMPTTE
jgi:hypothetical protein